MSYEPETLWSSAVKLFEQRQRDNWFDPREFGPGTRDKHDNAGGGGRYFQCVPTMHNEPPLNLYTTEDIMPRHPILAMAIMLITPVISGFWGAPAEAATCTPAFKGDLTVRFNNDGRTMTLVKPYAFIDASCTIWAVPRNAVIDGASIPQGFWGVVGGPFEGSYRNASVIHDWFCDRRTKSWQSVHRMFYNAMIVSKVPLVKAKTLFAAVWAGGPRWTSQAVINNLLFDRDALESDVRFKNDLKEYIRTNRRVGPFGLMPPMPGRPLQVDLDDGQIGFIARHIKNDDLSLNEVEKLSETARTATLARSMKFPVEDTGATTKPIP
jgi:hypothetical protein